MIRIHHTLFALAAAGVGMFSIPAVANAFSLVDRTGFTDTQFNDLIKTGKFTELFVAESRIGNNSTSTAERELGINTAIIPDPNNPNQLVGGLPVVSGERAWTSGALVDFVLEYTGSLVKYTVGGQLLSSTAFSGPVTDIFLRTRAAGDVSKGINGSTMGLSDLVFEEVGIGSLSSSVTGTGSDVDYLQIANISAPFKLTGKSMMSWIGNNPKNSQLAYQIKVGNTESQSIPEPATVGALLLTGALALGSRKQQKA
ncbi:PEP-CTERM sorting domain-containing protein [Planktothrix sp. FACHB-1355]|uniref:PEP-CTERM sorting domain-containing protein n=1 Tax=Aerosakkonema funiforme FACHB-1375 TaxID=2949571 RepID=A0A926ZIJ2_9CYAN|nr:MULTISPECIES: choice-of-anchor W domain-containing protein [Oscillatoriales]MBD2184493.1 PEP-CTERM sorting domain-containing protein [Aerosakkonema funiforme FACHB-1375]MBD3559374.1 PEP-CTERM sorting domain-containing protein [Planktothrix sp. FACHB-1355]